MSSCTKYRADDEDSEQGRHYRTGDMNKNQRTGPAPLLAQQVMDRLATEGRERCQAAEKAGRECEPPFNRQSLELIEGSNHEAHQEAPDHVGDQRAERNRWKNRIEGETEHPSDQGSGSGTTRNGYW